MSDIDTATNTEQKEAHIGRCDCGGVSYTIDGPLRSVVNCHCHRCRRITGHFMAATWARTEHLKFENDSTLRWYEAGQGVFYGFCDTCGSSLFWKADDEPDGVSICAGPLDPPTGLETTKVLWLAEVSDYHTPQPNLSEFQHDS